MFIQARIIRLLVQACVCLYPVAHDTIQMLGPNWLRHASSETRLTPAFFKPMQLVMMARVTKYSLECRGKWETVTLWKDGFLEQKKIFDVAAGSLAAGV